MREGFKLDPPHSDDCYLAEQDRQEFIVYDGNKYLKRNGHRGGSATWEAFRCNCAHCPALMLVRWDVLMDFLASGFGPSSDPEETA